jgi:carbamoyltransferase
LRHGGISPADLDAVALNGYHMPYPKDRNAMLDEYRTTDSVATKLKRLAKYTPLKKVHRLRRRHDRLSQVMELGVAADRIHFVEHHTAHAAAAFYGWGYHEEPVLVLTNDGAGDGLCATVSIGRGGKLERLKIVPQSESIGNIYAVMTFMMGMVPLEHEYKLMGMAPYAPESGREAVLKELRPLMQFAPNDGMVWRRTKGCPETYYIYNFLRRRLDLKRFDWVCAGLQAWTEEMLAQWVRNCIQATGIYKVALSGGVFMNVKANKIISELPEVETMFVFPSCGDETNAIGAAYWVEADHGTDGTHIPALRDLYWGPTYDDMQIEDALKHHNGRGKWTYRRAPHIDATVAELLARGEVVARCTGRAEFGARALGNRSILADASNTRLIRVINDMIKSRDFWMPFAPAILEERAADYLINPKGIAAPYMIMSFDTTSRVEDLRASIHPYDQTARPQIVYEDWDPDFYQILKEFERLTGRGVILNTSFNLHGYPIVNSPEDALEVLEKSDLRHLALGNWLVEKNG